MSRSFPGSEVRVKSISSRRNSPCNILVMKDRFCYGQSMGLVRECEGSHAFAPFTVSGWGLTLAVLTPEMIFSQISAWPSPLIPVALSFNSSSSEKSSLSTIFQLAFPTLSHCPFARLYFLLSTYIIWCVLYLICILFVSPT